MRKCVRRVIVVFSLLFTAIAALAQAPPTADTFTFQETPNKNYGSSPILVVQPGAVSFLQFDLSVFPAGVTVNKATLRLYVDAVASPGSFSVYEVDTPWSEKTLTFKNSPPLGAVVGTSQSITSKNQFVLIDITSLVQNWISGAVGNNGIALALSTGEGIFSFDSKESVFTSHEPELEVVLNGPAGPQGPSGPQGLQGAQGTPGLQGPADLRVRPGFPGAR